MCTYRLAWDGCAFFSTVWKSFMFAYASLTCGNTVRVRVRVVAYVSLTCGNKIRVRVRCICVTDLWQHTVISVTPQHSKCMASV